MTGRPKGYMNWDPKPDTARVLVNVQAVLAEYRSYGPMTVRQIFYRLVGEYGYDKTERAYKRLAEYLVKARRAGIIKFGSIRDDGTTDGGSGGWDSRGQFWLSVRDSAESFQLDHQAGQPFQIELWCEAAGMVPMLGQMTAEWHIPVYSTGGFSSVTVTHQVSGRIEREASDNDRATVFLHVGDFDPSGESIFTSMQEDIAAFLEGRGVFGRFDPVRVALTAEQVETYDLPTAPPKMSDSRSANWIGETTQAEAMPPDLLREVVVGAVQRYIDTDVLADVLEREEDDRQEIERVLRIAEGAE